MKYIVSSLWYRVRDRFNVINKNLADKGYYVIEDLLSKDQCNRLLDELNSDFLKGKQNWEDNVGSDMRIYGWKSPVLDDTGTIIEKDFQSYIGSLKVMKSFIMANRVAFKPGNEGSGGGWHRDSVNRRQLKLMVYLTDVDIENGPFEYISKSHKVESKLFRGLFYKNNRRIEMLSQNELSKRRTFVGKAGMAIVFDSSGIHRGRPVLSESRTAITYYTFTNEIPSHIKSLMT